MHNLNHSQQIKTIVDEVELIDHKSFSVKGKPHQLNQAVPYQNFNGPLNKFGENPGKSNHETELLLKNQLAGLIYSKYYCGIPDNSAITSQPLKAEREAFMNTLSAANKTTEGLDYNWLVYSIDPNGVAYVSKNGHLRWLSGNDYQFSSPDTKTLEVNSYVNIIRTKESRTSQPVFYHVYSNELFPPKADIARFYWNIEPEGAAKLVEGVTTILNHYKVPFQFKCLNHPALYNRNDSAVLYVDKKDVNLLKKLLRPVIAMVKEHFKDAIPWFTHQLHKGLSFAEDPGSGQSFGMSRSNALADALLEVHKFKIKASKKKLEVVEAKLIENGIPIERIYSNLHTATTYSFPNY